MDKTNFLKKYRLAAQVATNFNMDAYNYEELSKICNAILEAASLKEELNSVSDGKINITLNMALSKIEAQKFDSTPKLKKHFLETECVINDKEE